MLFVVEDRLNVLKYNIDFGEKGVGVHRGREKIHTSTMREKRAIYGSVSTLLSLIDS